MLATTPREAQLMFTNALAESTGNYWKNYQSKRECHAEYVVSISDTLIPFDHAIRVAKE